eukprot:12745244-Ditylum_brightwellii.AAC.1
MADRRNVEDLNKANMELTAANKQLTNQVAQMSEQLSAITKLIEAPPKSTNTKSNRFGGNSARKRIDWDPHGYCWSCGFCIVKVTTASRVTQKRRGIRKQQQDPTPWGAIRRTRIMFSGETKEG